jgi:hypothetical protein
MCIPFVAGLAGSSSPSSFSSSLLLSLDELSESLSESAAADAATGFTSAVCSRWLHEASENVQVAYACATQVVKKKV